ncbi:MAG: thiolase family protein [Chloroflexota bacterium]|nr:MAG: thiolase family protein [Chloroflexota bacterium]
MTDVAIVDAVRSPVGIRTQRRYSDICRVMPDDLLAYCLKALVERTGIDPKIVEDVIAGTSDRPHNSGRFASLTAGFPPEVAGCQVNRQCAGSMSALHFAAMEIMTGYAEVNIACGVESMSRDWQVKRQADPPPAQSVTGAPVPPDYRSEMLVAAFAKHGGFANMGQSAEAIARKWDISRDDIDDFAFWSQQKAAKATQEGKFKNEIVPISVKMPDGTTKIVEIDETIRFELDRDKMRDLPPAFIPPPFMDITEGRVTAANSSPLSDGAAAALFMSREKAKELGFKARAYIKPNRMCVLGCDPGPYQLTGPIPATQKILKRTGMKISEFGWFEVNEAFASVVIAWAKEMGIPWNDPRINPHGGAIALGHPLGESGVKLLATAVNGMEDKDANFGLMTMCVGGGQGIATIIERE